MKIIFFGTPQFAVNTLQSLHDVQEIDIIAVVTQPDKPVGRKKIFTAPPVKQLAKELGLKVIQPNNKKELIKELKNIEIDFFVVVAFGMILPQTILDIPKYGSINIHASLLPKYRGASPIQEALLHGDEDTGISIMKMDEELDHGPIYLLKRVKIEEEDNLESLTEKLAKTGGNIAPIVLRDIKNQLLAPIEQKHQQATYCKKIKKSDGEINWNKDAKTIQNMIKAYTPWPSAFTTFNNKKIKILSSNIEKEPTNHEPGTFFKEDNILKIATGKGKLIPQLLQPEGKKEMEAPDFLNGYKERLKREKNKNKSTCP